MSSHDPTGSVDGKAAPSVGSQRNEWIPKLTDFGIAKRLEVESGATQEGEILGTPSYMAPEQAGGRNREIGPATDIYSLGVIVYEMLTGRVPLQGPTTLDTLMLVRTEEPVPPRRLQPKVPRDLETICLKCLEKEPGRHIQTPWLWPRTCAPSIKVSRSAPARWAGWSACGNGSGDGLRWPRSRWPC